MRNRAIRIRLVTALFIGLSAAAALAPGTAQAAIGPQCVPHGTHCNAYCVCLN